MTNRIAACLTILALGAPPAARAQEPPAPEAAKAAVERTSRLQGRAYLGRNRDVTGAVVSVRNPSDASRVWITSTDAKGVFRVEGLADGSYDVRVERDGLATVEKSEVGVRFPFRAVVELPMTHADATAETAASAGSANGTTASAAGSLRLSGVVRDVSLDPVGEARVRIVDTTGSTDPRVATTGADGTFAFDDLPAGTWWVQVRGVGRLPIRTRLAVTADTELEAILVVQPATYVPSPFDLMPPEEPVVPEAFRPAAPASEPQPESAVRTAK